MKKVISKSTIILMISLLSLCCSKRPTQYRDTRYYGPVLIQGSDFVLTATPLYTSTVETSMVTQNDEPIYLPSFVPLSGNIAIDRLDGTVPLTVDSGIQHAYVLQHDGVYYNFYKANNGIKVKLSHDLIEWVEMNDGALVLTEDRNTDWRYTWNPGVAVDDQGVWHLLVECARNADQSDVGLCYATSKLEDGSLNFDANKVQSKVIDGSGNAWVGFVPGKGVFTIYGKVNTPTQSYGNEWYISGAVLKNGVWIENEKFHIGFPGIHICDPHLLETEDGTTMLISYDQHSVYELKSPKSLSEIYDSIDSN
jgi:hypothetical protein